MQADAELETDVLAAVIHDARLIGPMLRFLEAEDFAHEHSRMLYAAIVGVAKRDGRDAVAPATVRAELRRQGVDERLVLELLNPLVGIGLVGSFEPKCRRLRDLRRHRRMVSGISAVSEAPDAESARATMAETMYEVDRLATHDSLVFADVVDELMDEQEAELADEARIRTGLPSLDRLLGGGLAPGWFVTVGSRTSVGKTTLVLQIAANALKAGQRVLYVSLEERRTQIAERLIRHIRRLPTPASVFSVGMDDDLRSLPFIIETDRDLDVITSEIEQRAMETAGLGLVVVDYIGLVRVRGRENRVQEVSEVTKALKAASSDLALPIVGAAQINRSPTARSDHRPTLADFKDSGSVEEDSDVAILLHRERITDTAGELRLEKNRYGPKGEMPIQFRYAVGHIGEGMP